MVLCIICVLNITWIYIIFLNEGHFFYMLYQICISNKTVAIKFVFSYCCGTRNLVRLFCICFIFRSPGLKTSSAIIWRLLSISKHLSIMQTTDLSRK